MSFSVVSTFSGCGGSSLGYQMAGGKVRLAVEWDKNAVDTYRLNFPDTPIYHGDIVELRGEEALELSGLRRGELDVLDGSPPCQGFSTSGKRMYHDPRNSLFMEFARLIEVFRPKVLVMENVSGMVKGKMKILFAKILTVLKDSGYRVSARLLDAAYFNVPQHRRRMIFIGVRNDLGIEPSHPKVQSKLLSVGRALNGHIPDRVPPRTNTRSNVWADKTLPGKSHSRHFSIQRAHPNRPCPTIPKSVKPNASCQLLHPSEKRVLSISELKVLSSYPPEFQLIGGFTDQWARIGNSVPPNFMRAIAEHIRDTVLSTSKTANVD